MSAKTLIIATAALAASTAMTLPAFAAGGDGTGPAANPPAATAVTPRTTVMFNLLDTNQDGSISKEEFAVLSNATFESLDTNHDGKLSADELRGRIGAALGQRFGRGGPGDRGPGMNWQDRDGRGWGQGRMDNRPGTRFGAMGRMGFNGPGQQGAGPQQQAPGPRLSFNDIDTNHDGVISQDEFNAHQLPLGQGRGLGPRR